MPRTARKKSESGIYHIVLRGINKQTVFYDDEDRKVFLNRLKLVNEIEPHKLFAFCLMDNHIHLLMQEIEVPVGKVIQRLLTSYIYWYNRKYERVGNLFQDRFKSEPINDDAYLLCALRYIHQNPVKAQMVQTVDDFPWSSHGLYVNGKKSFVETDFILEILGGTVQYMQFVQEPEKGEFIDNNSQAPISDAKLKGIFQQICFKHKINDFGSLSKESRDEIVLILKNIDGATLRQISRLTGISVNTVRTIK